MSDNFRSKRPKKLSVLREGSAVYHQEHGWAWVTHNSPGRRYVEWLESDSPGIVDLKTDLRLPGEPNVPSLPPELQREWKKGDKCWIRHKESGEWFQGQFVEEFKEGLKGNIHLSVNEEAWLIPKQSFKERAIYIGSSVEEEKVLKEEGVREETFGDFHCDSCQTHLVEETIFIGNTNRVLCWKCYDKHLIDTSTLEAEKERGKADMIPVASIPLDLTKPNWNTPCGDLGWHKNTRPMSWAFRTEGKLVCPSCLGPISTINGTRECVLDNCLSIKDKEENKLYKSKLCKKCGMKSCMHERT